MNTDKTFLFLVPFWISNAQDDPILHFEDYPVAQIFAGKPAKLDLGSHPQARTFRTRLIEGAKNGPNFAGHYTIVSWGCGSPCQTIAIIDAVTGRVCAFEEASNGFMYRLNSNLIIANPLSKQMLEEWHNDPPSWAVTIYYLWDSKSLENIGVTYLPTELPDIVH